VQGFKAAIAARNALGDNPPAISSIAPASTPGPSTAKPKSAAPTGKKKAGLKGVVVKKKKLDPSTSKPKSLTTEQAEEAPQKRRRVSESSPNS